MIRRVRLFSGLVLFAYLLTHLTNHAIGLISLDAAQAALVPLQYPWNFPPLLALLYGSLLVHFLLALWSLYRRRRLLTMPPVEAAQLLLGLLIVPLLAIHIIGQRGAAVLADPVLGYPYLLYIYFKLDPASAWQQSLVTIVAWGHGCIGVYFWLRYRRWFLGARPYLYAFAILFPVLALLGMLSAGRELLARLSVPGAEAALLEAVKWPPDETRALLFQIEDYVLAIYFAVLAGVVLARGLRVLAERRRGLVRVRYADGRSLRVAPGTSILEASRAAGIPHASLCGGRGRCSTCRVRVSEGFEALPETSEDERKVLARVGAGPTVRLACQTRPTSEITVAPLLPATASWRDAISQPGYRQGTEREVVILFADLRGFTAISEQTLPYDVVFLLNRYFRASGEAIEQAGGRVDKFIGDGVMALFGVDEPADSAARNALNGARALVAAIDRINETLADHLPAPLRVGVGLHLGTVIVGEMGYGDASGVTAIGDAVNTASRLEALTKDYGAQLVISERVFDAAALDHEVGERHEVDIRGRSEPLAVRVFSDADALSAALE